LAWTRPFLLFALAFLVLAFPAWAEAQTVTRSNSTDGFADGGFNVPSEITRDVTFPTTDFPSGATVSDVIVTLDFAKIDAIDPTCGPPPTSATAGPANGELYYKLTSPQGTTIDLISAGAYPSGTPYGGQVVVTLSDAAATAVGGGSPTSGTFRPSQALSAFDGQDPEGTWTLTIGDTFIQDANCFYNVDIAVTAESPTTPTTIADLIESVEALNLKSATENSLLKKLTNAQKNLDADDTAGACDKLASFIAEVTAQSGKKIDTEDADALITEAEAVGESLECG
jgi:subtilisin-like proprotein convertase family protein